MCFVAGFPDADDAAALHRKDAMTAGREGNPLHFGSMWQKRDVAGLQIVEPCHHVPACGAEKLSIGRKRQRRNHAPPILADSATCISDGVPNLDAPASIAGGDQLIVR